MRDTTLTFLGTGTSVGVPVIGCPCAVCHSPNPHNTRTRSSIVLETPRQTILVDFGPDLRQQALRENLSKIDAVLVTHQHLDHIMGFDDLRAFCWHRETPLPMYGGPDTLAMLATMFPWAFAKVVRKGYVRPAPRCIDGPFTLLDLDITPLPVEHAGVEMFGFRFELPSGHSCAYLSDVKSIPAPTAALLHDLDILIIDALRRSQHPTHMSHREALEAAEVIGAKHTLFTHLTHDLDVDELSASLPSTVSVAHDGMKLHFQAETPCAIIPSTPTRL